MECGSAATAFAPPDFLIEAKHSRTRTASSTPCAANQLAGSKAVAWPQHSKFRSRYLECGSAATALAPPDFLIEAKHSRTRTVSSTPCAANQLAGSKAVAWPKHSKFRSRYLECGSAATAFATPDFLIEAKYSRTRTASSTPCAANQLAGSKAVAWPKHSKFR